MESSGRPDKRQRIRRNAPKPPASKPSGGCACGLSTLQEPSIAPRRRPDKRKRIRRNAAVGGGFGNRRMHRRCGRFIRPTRAAAYPPHSTRAAQRISGSASGSVSSMAGSPGIRWRSPAQSPKSICRHRAEQNGRSGLSGPQGTGLAQVGQRTTSLARFTKPPPRFGPRTPDTACAALPPDRPGHREARNCRCGRRPARSAPRGSIAPP